MTQTVQGPWNGHTDTLLNTTEDIKLYGGGGDGNYDWGIQTQQEPGFQVWMPTKEFWWNFDSSFKFNLTTVNYTLTMCLEYNYAKC